MGTRLTSPLRLLTWLAILGPAWYIVLTAAFGASVSMGVGVPAQLPRAAPFGSHAATSER